MTRTVFVAAMLALALVPDPASAVSLSGFGLRTGVAASAIRSDHTGGFAPDTRAGFAGSLFCRIALGPSLSIQPEVGWASKGGAGDLTISYVTPTGSTITGTADYPFEQRVDYLEVPVLLRVGPGRDSFFEPYFVLGPGIAFRTGQKTQTDYRPVEPQNPAVQPASIFEGAGTFDHPSYRAVDFSSIFGFGLAMGRGVFRVVLDARYATGLVGALETVDRKDAHNRSWITTLGVELR